MVNSNSSFTDSLGITWNPGDPLPNPGCDYIGSNGLLNVVDMSGMFLFVTRTVDTLNLSIWDTSNVVTMAAMFHSASINSLRLSGFDTSNVTDMSWMFHNTYINNLNLSHFDTNKVTNVAYMLCNYGETSIPVLTFKTTNNMTDLAYILLCSGG